MRRPSWVHYTKFSTGGKRGGDKRRRQRRLATTQDHAPRASESSSSRLLLPLHAHCSFSSFFLYLPVRVMIRRHLGRPVSVISRRAFAFLVTILLRHRDGGGSPGGGGRKCRRLTRRRRGKKEKDPLTAKPARPPARSTDRPPARSSEASSSVYSQRCFLSPYVLFCFC